MAVVFYDGCDHFHDTDFLKKGYSMQNRNGTYSMDTGRSGSGQSYKTVSGSDSWGVRSLHIALPASQTQGGMGFGFKISSIPTQAGVGMIGLWSAGVNAAQIHVTLNPDGSFSICSGGTVHATGGALGAANSWHWVELKWTIHSSTGSATLKVDGNQQLSVSGVNTTNYYGTYINTVILFSKGVADYALGVNQGTAITAWMDDIYIFDNNTGVTDFLGDVTVDTKYPTANGTTINGTPSTGNNYACVDEDHADMTDYVTFDAVNELDTYVVEDVDTGYTVHAVQVVAFANKTHAGTAQIASVIRQGGSDYVHGTPVGLGYDATFAKFLYEKDPTNAAWTPATFNANEFGVKKTA